MARNIAHSDLTITVLEQMLAKRRAELSRLTKERAQIVKQLAAVDAQLHAVGGSSDKASTVTRSGRARNDKSLVSTLEEVLSKSNKPLSVGDIVQGVLDSGYHSTAANFRAMVNQTLIRERKRFASPERALYILKK
jgi:ABC-type transporter Mla subunit MlaD